MEGEDPGRPPHRCHDRSGVGDGPKVKNVDEAAVQTDQEGEESDESHCHLGGHQVMNGCHLVPRL